jgi:hypothetical protein
MNLRGLWRRGSKETEIEVEIKNILEFAWP